MGCAASKTQVSLGQASNFDQIEGGSPTSKPNLPTPQKQEIAEGDEGEESNSFREVASEKDEMLKQRAADFRLYPNFEPIV